MLWPDIVTYIFDSSPSSLLKFTLEKSPPHLVFAKRDGGWNENTSVFYPPFLFTYHFFHVISTDLKTYRVENGWVQCQKVFFLIRQIKWLNVPLPTWIMYYGRCEYTELDTTGERDNDEYNTWFKCHFVGWNELEQKNLTLLKRGN